MQVSSLLAVPILYACVASGSESESAYTDKVSRPLESLSSGAHNVPGLRTAEPFQSSLATNPLLHVKFSNDACEDSYVLLSPQAEHLSGNQAWMMDRHGSLVWYHEDYGSIKSLQVQTYRGRQYLTYWVGDDKYWWHGSGFYKMLDETYTLAYVLRAANGLDGDYHEFSITLDDTALITAYTKVPYNLTDRGRENGFIWDCVFQELDVATNELIFEWRASEHFKPADMTIDSWTEWTGTEDDPWDWFHLNSVEKDFKGNYLVSARYMNGLSYVAGFTGNTLWNLGGKLGSFDDLTDGNATRMVDPQMARWTDNGAAITLFDNIALWSFDSEQQQSHAIKIGIGLRTREAKMMLELVHPSGIFADGEGSMQQLANGNYLISYGFRSMYSEYSHDGQLLCETQYALLDTDQIVRTEPPIQTYRIYKYNWIGRPERPPSVLISDAAFVVSWNGATELRGWRLAGRRRFSPRWSVLATAPKSGFETTIPLGDSSASEFQLTALGEDNEILQVWLVRTDGSLTALYMQSSAAGQGSRLRTSLWLTLCISFALLVLFNRRALLFKA